MAMEQFSALQANPVLLAFLATCFTWFVTALGAAMVFFQRDQSESAGRDVRVRGGRHDRGEFLVAARAFD